MKKNVDFNFKASSQCGYMKPEQNIVIKKSISKQIGVWLLPLVFIPFFAVTMLSTGCSSPEKTPIRIGVNAWPPCELWYIAKDQGFFEDVKVDIVRFSSWRDNMLSLYKGQTDITHASYFNALYYSEKGEKGKIILRTETIEGGEGFVVKNAIQNKEQLKGKTIAVETGTDEHFLLYKALNSFGLQPKDVTLLSVSSGEASQKFINNEVDGCFTYEPFMSEAASKGDGRIVSTTKDYPGYMIDVLVGSSELIDKRKKDVITVIRAWYKAQEYLKNNPEKGFTLMAGNEKMESSDFGAFYASFSFYTIQDNQSYLKSEEFYHKLDDIKTFLLSEGFLKEKMDVRNLVDANIVESLQPLNN